MSEVYWLSQAFDMIKRYVACVQAAFADPHLVRFEMTTNFGCALNAESIIDCLSQMELEAFLKRMPLDNVRFVLSRLKLER